MHATFTTGKAFVRVAGELENTRKDERGVILDYVIPPISPDAVFSNDLEQSLRLADADSYEGNVFPVAAMCGQGRGIAVAIPPTEPCVFGMAGDKGGLSARFYLGLSPEPQRFPNRAAFSFLLYAVEPDWGFRSALAAYYRFFPDYYTPRLKREGLFMFQMADRVPPNIDQYGFDLVESQWKQEILQAAIARDERHGIATFPYMIVGPAGDQVSAETTQGLRRSHGGLPAVDRDRPGRTRADQGKRGQPRRHSFEAGGRVVGLSRPATGASPW